MHVILGLGNPGLRYRNTWHNLGFMLVERLAGAAGFRSGRGSYLECRLQLEGHDVLLVKPTTFMNLSGQAAAEVSAFYKVDVADLLVVFDDMDLPLGELRFRESGSGGNHNGMSHVVQHLGPRVARLRLGFRPPRTVESAQWKSFVLAPIPESVRGAVTDMLEEAESGVRILLRSGIREAMNRCNRSARERLGGDPAAD
ncbi:MAG: aminoacyl-tRNA hydrolase [Candidatus Delongbacteria bacterium]